VGGVPGPLGSPGQGPLASPEASIAREELLREELLRIMERWVAESPLSSGFAQKRALGETQEQWGAATLSRGRQTGPVRFVQKLLQDWHLDEKGACLLLGFEESEASYVRDLLSGRISLRGRDVKHRIALLLQIREALDSLFRSLDVENDWLREPQEQLEKRSPMDLLMEGSFTSILKAKEFVDIVAGR
jgi:uncharacterized protein (DUF2384 family)